MIYADNLHPGETLYIAHDDCKIVGHIPDGCKIKVGGHLRFDTAGKNCTLEAAGHIIGQSIGDRSRVQGADVYLHHTGRNCTLTSTQRGVEVDVAGRYLTINAYESYCIGQQNIGLTCHLHDPAESPPLPQIEKRIDPLSKEPVYYMPLSLLDGPKRDALLTLLVELKHCGAQVKPWHSVDTRNGALEGSLQITNSQKRFVTGESIKRLMQAYMAPDRHAGQGR